MKKKERETLAQQGEADLAEKEKQLREASWKLRLQKSTGQLENPSRLQRHAARHGPREDVPAGAGVEGRGAGK